MSLSDPSGLKLYFTDMDRVHIAEHVTPLYKDITGIIFNYMQDRESDEYKNYRNVLFELKYGTWRQRDNRSRRKLFFIFERNQQMAIQFVFDNEDYFCKEVESIDERLNRFRGYLE